MNTQRPSGKQLVAERRAGTLPRRRFVQAATALGLPPALIAVAANQAFAQYATPSSEDIFASDGSPRDEGMENVTRGQGGQLKIIQYQAPTSLSPHTSTGYKDYDASQLVLEPLMVYLTDAQLYGVLIEEVPSLENGLLAEDGLSVTFRLKEGVLWSDGEPVTSDDIKFTIEWVLNSDNAATTRGTYEGISEVEVQDELTAVVHFADPNPFWFEPFTSYVNGVLYPIAHP